MPELGKPKKHHDLKGQLNIELIKRGNPLDQVMESYGLQLKKNGSSCTFKTKCPFHEDDTPSLSINTQKEGGLWNCFGCEAKGDVISFVERIEGISTKDAIQKLSLNVSPISVDQKTSPSVEVSEHRKIELLNEISTLYHKSFKENQSAQNYLIKRGFNDKSLWGEFQIGYCDGTALKNLLPEKGELLEELKAIGVLNEKGNESFYRSIVFPIQGLIKQTTALYGRSTNFQRHLYSKGKRGGCWNAQAIKSSHTIILTESIIDAMSMIELGFPSAVPLYGTNGFTEDHRFLLCEHSIKEVILLLDNDDAGRSAVADLLLAMLDMNIKISTASLPNGVKDPNQFLVEGGSKEQMNELLQERHVIHEPQLNEKIEEDAVISKGSDFITLRFGTMTYEVKGFKSTFTDILRVVISVHAEGKSSHIDRIDLYTARNRKTFASACSAKFDVQSAKIESHLLNLVQEVEKIQQENSETKAQESQEEQPYQMTKEEERDALSFLKRPDLIDQISKDIGSMGYIGEDEAKLLTYLSATSRITGGECNADPISLCVRAHAASGKSVMFEVVSGLMPPESVKSYSRITSQSLYYMNRNELKHKILIIDEKAGSSDSDYSLRNLMSRGKLTLAVVTKDHQTGESKTITIEMEGPTVIWESTTANEINEENLSRVYELYLQSSSREQTQKIHESQRSAFDLGHLKEEDDTESIKLRHQNAQRMLKPLKVVIPYHNKLTFPSEWTRTRRDNKRFLSLIASIALLHQHQREIKTLDGIQYIEANKEDYAIAYRLVSSILESTLSPIQRESWDFLGRIIKMVSTRAEDEAIDLFDFIFTRREVREFCNVSARKTRELLADLCSLEYLETVTGKRGGSFRYRLLVGEEELENRAVSGLLSPQNL
jgi:DNA primase